METPAVIDYPAALSWLDPGPPAAPVGGLEVCASGELRQLYPRWPQPYVLLVTINTPARFSVSLFDRPGHTIQVNLFNLEPFGRAGEVLLGGSSRIDPEDPRYLPRPSEHSRTWIVERVVPWLAERGASRLVVRAHFAGADKFFGGIGFVPDTALGLPYLARDLAPAPAFPAVAEVAIPETYGAFRPVADLIRKRLAAHGDAELEYFLASRDNPASAPKAHAEMNAHFEQVALEEYEVQWELASAIRENVWGRRL